MYFLGIVVVGILPLSIPVLTIASVNTVTLTVFLKRILISVRSQMPNLHKIGFHLLPSGTKSAKLVRLPNGCAGEQMHFAGRKSCMLILCAKSH